MTSAVRWITLGPGCGLIEYELKLGFLAALGIYLIAGAVVSAIEDIPHVRK